MAQTKLSQFLKTARQKAELSQGDVSDKLGYSTPQFISNWERGVSQPPVTTLRKIAQLYQISEDNLFKLLEEVAIDHVRLNLRRQFSAVTKKRKS